MSATTSSISSHSSLSQLTVSPQASNLQRGGQMGAALGFARTRKKLILGAGLLLMVRPKLQIARLVPLPLPRNIPSRPAHSRPCLHFADLLGRLLSRAVPQRAAVCPSRRRRQLGHEDERVHLARPFLHQRHAHADAHPARCRRQ